VTGCTKSIDEWNPRCVHEPHADATTLEYIAHYAAPGIGWHGKCKACGKDFAVVGTSAYDPTEMAHLMNPEDTV
jgi:hypothetical protein